MRGGKPYVLILALLLVVPAAPLTAGGDAQEPTSPNPTTATPANAAPGVEDRLEPGLLEELEAVNHLIVRFHEEVPADLTGRSALDVHYRFQSLPAVYATAPPSTVEALASNPAIAHVERADKRIEFDLDSATLATKAREVWDPAANNTHLAGNPAPITVDGETIDGSGVGIAVIDSGIDYTHPDLPRGDKVKRSFVATGQGVVEAP